MKLYEQHEHWIATKGFGPNYSVRMTNGVYTSGVGGGGMYTHPDWATAEKSVREKYESIYGGLDVKLNCRAWTWRQMEDREQRHLTVFWRPHHHPQNIMTWSVSLHHSLSEGPFIHYERGGKASTWEGAIEAGRVALDALVALPFP